MKKRMGGFFLLFLSWGQILANVIPSIFKKNLVDFLVYEQAISAFLRREEVYHRLFSLPFDRIPFNYPPSALIVLLPLVFFPSKISAFLLTLFSLSALMISLWLTAKIIKIRLTVTGWIILTAFLSQTFPVKLTLILGQINLVVLLLTIGAIYFYTEKNNRLVSALFLGIAGAAKILPFFLLPLFLLSGDGIFVLLVLTFFLGANLLAGIGLMEEFFFSVIPDAVSSKTPAFYDQSVYALLLRLGISPGYSRIISLIVFIIIFAFIIYYFFLKVKKTEKKTKGLLIGKAAFLIMALTAIGGIFSWQHHLVLAYPFILYLFLSYLKKNSPGNHLIFFVSTMWIWFLLFFHFKDASSTLLSNPFVASYQTLLILFLLVVNLKRIFLSYN